MAWPIGQAILLIGGDCVYKTSVTGSTPTIRKNSPLQKERRVFFGCGDRVRVSGGHLCAKHRSTDRGGSRELEPTVLYLNLFVNIALSFLKSPPLAVPDIALTWSVAHLSTAALRFAPFIRHWRRSQPHPTSTARRAHNPKPKIKIFLS